MDTEFWPLFIFLLICISPTWVIPLFVYLRASKLKASRPKGSRIAQEKLKRFIDESDSQHSHSTAYSPYIDESIEELERRDLDNE